MRQIIAFSTAAGRQDAITTAAILAVSRKRNPRDHITGLLVAGGNRYLQVIEGPKTMVGALIERIHRDQRHLGVSVLVDRRIARRGFAGWSMVAFEAPTPSEFATFGDLVERMRGEVRERGLRDQLDCLEQRFAVAPVAPVASPWTLATSYPV